MKFIHRIPTSQYAYVEFEEEVESVADGIDNHRQYLEMYQDGAGVSTRQFAKLRRQVAYGIVDESLYYQCNKEQKIILHHIKLTLKDFEPNEQVVE